MIRLERILSLDSFSNSDEEDIEDNLEPSKTQIPYNKAFLSIALVDPQRTISHSLDELDSCMINKAALINSVDLLQKSDVSDEPKVADSRVVNFNDSPNVYSLSTISEHSDTSPFTSSPVGYLERALDSLPSSDSEQLSDQSFVSNEDSFVDLSSAAKSSLVSFIAVNDNVNSGETLSNNHSEIVDLNKCDVELDPRAVKEDSELMDDVNGFSDESVSSTTSKIDELSDPLSDDKSPLQAPKSILKKTQIRDKNISSEPTLKMWRRRTLATSHFFGARDMRDAKSLSYVDDSKFHSTFPPRKKHSAPPRMQLAKLRSSLKINEKILNSIKQSTEASNELVDLLIMQAENLNKQIKLTLLYNTIKYGGIAAAALILTCCTLRYCYMGRKH